MMIDIRFREFACRIRVCLLLYEERDLDLFPSEATCLPAACCISELAQ